MLYLGERTFEDAELQHADNKQLMYVLDWINDAISARQKISFIYNDYGIDFKLKPRREEAYVVNPYQMVANNGHYYLIANYDKYDDISHYRLDRMTSVEILDEKAKSQKKIRDFQNGFNLPKQIEVRLKCNEDAMFYWALQYEPFVEVVEPVTLRSRIYKAVKEMNRKYGK